MEASPQPKCRDADAVRHVRTVTDLTDLFRHLGYQPDDGPATEGWSAVARWRTFRVVGTEAADPAGAARSMARRLGATAQPGLVAAIGAEALALAAPQIGLARAAPVLVILFRAPPALELDLLRDLRPRPGTTVLQHAFRVGDVLGTETVGERFSRGLSLAAGARPRGRIARRFIGRASAARPAPAHACAAGCLVRRASPTRTPPASA